MGVYKIINSITGEFYVGATAQGFIYRYYKHKSDYVRRSRKSCPLLYKAFDEYGIDKFYFEMMEQCSKDIIREREEYYIKLLNPIYNICQEPTKGGSPNKGRKLTKEWKERIGEKAKLYSHTGEVLSKVIKQNKTGAIKLVFKKEGKELQFNSWVEANVYFNLPSNSSNIKVAYKRGTYKGWTVTKLSTQSKSIEVITEKESIVFNTFNECDRYFDMWRGYTSTKVLRKELLLDKYKYNLL